jgi:methylase of polypeptide subunit release factors
MNELANVSREALAAELARRNAEAPKAAAGAQTAGLSHEELVAELRRRQDEEPCAYLAT